MGLTIFTIFSNIDILQQAIISWFHWDLPITPEEIIESEKHFSSETKAFIDDAIKKIVKI